MEERIQVGTTVSGIYNTDGAYKVTRMTKACVYGRRLKLRCTWTADASMQNAAYEPTDEFATESPEVYLGRIKTSKIGGGEYVWNNKEQLYLSPGKHRMCTYTD